MKHANEKDLDIELEKALVGSVEFADWFLDRTIFSGCRGRLDWSRSNYVWGPVPVQLPNSDTGVMETVIKESETDILVVYALSDGRRVGIHIENKVGLGKFRPNQADFYVQRAAAWKGMERYGNYTEWTTVLVSPTAFRDRFPVESQKFDSFISHEEIAAHVPLFDPNFDPATFVSIRKHFHALIQTTLGFYPGAEPTDAPEHIDSGLTSETKAYLPVNGMYGGFSYWFEGDGSDKHLIVESWSRVVEGSGERHRINAQGITLIEAGFV